jgi:hypothetical protein
VSETSIRWAAASEQLAQNRAQLSQRQRPVMSDAQRQALARLSPEQAFHFAYSNRADDDVPVVPEAPHPASLDGRRSGLNDSWRNRFDQAWAEAFSPLERTGNEQPWSQAISHGRRTGVLAPEAPAEPDPPPAPPAEPEPAPTTPAAAPPADPPEPIADLFAAMKEQLDLFATSAPQPSDAAQLRNLWRSLPDDDRQAVAQHLESADFAPGYFRDLEADWAAVLTGDALVRRLEDARRLQPEIAPATLLADILSAAKQQD